MKVPSAREKPATKMDWELLQSGASHLVVESSAKVWSFRWLYLARINLSPDNRVEVYFTTHLVLVISANPDGLYEGLLQRSIWGLTECKLSASILGAASVDRVEVLTQLPPPPEENTAI
jgi:hypothetical protein